VITKNPMQLKALIKKKNEFDYAKDISFNETCETILRVVEAMGEKSF